MMASKKLNNRPAAIKPRHFMGVEPLEYTASGRKGEALFHQMKMRLITFYEGINNETKQAIIFIS